MARYRKVEGRVWNDADFRTLSDDAKLLWFLLMTHINQTMLGAMRASVGSLASDLGWPFERLLKAFDEVLATGMAKHDAEASFLWLPNFLKYNRPENPNVVKAWAEAIDLLPECAMKTLVWSGCERCVEGMGEGFQKAFKSLGEGYANTGAGTGAGTGSKAGDVREAPAPPPVNVPKKPTREANRDDPMAEDSPDAARRLLEKLTIPTQGKILAIVTEAVQLKATRLAVPPYSAAVLIRRQAELARSAGETVDRFWFEDARYETERAEPRKPMQTAEAVERVDEMPEGLDTVKGQEIWQMVRNGAAKEINRQSFDTWLKPLLALGVRDGVLYLKLPSPAFAMAPDRYSEVLAKLLPHGVEQVKGLYLGSAA